jgi:hypothetical protein
MQSGEQIGKLLGGLATAIKGAQKDAIANKLMTDQAISEQPGAGQTQDLGTLPGGPQSNAGTSDSGPDPDPDPTSITYPSGGGINPGGLDSPGLNTQPDVTYQDIPALNQAVGAQKAASALSSSPSDFTLNASDYTGGGGKGTVGGLVHTGGVQEMELQKEMMAQQIQKASMADKLAEAAGTGRYAKRATPVTRRGVTMTGDGGDSVWDSAGGGNTPTGKTTKSAKYVAGTGNFETDETTDQPDQIKTDFEAFHPGIDLGDFAGATRDDKGNYIIPGKPDASGNPTVKATIPKAEGDQVMMRMDAARKRAGMASTNAAVPQGQGTQDNPVPLTGDPTKSSLQLRSLATGTWVMDPKTGKKYKIGA